MMDDCGELVVSGRFGSWGLRAWEVRVGVGGWWRMEEGECLEWLELSSTVYII